MNRLPGETLSGNGNSGTKKPRKGAAPPKAKTEAEQTYKAFLDDKHKGMKAIKAVIDKLRTELKDGTIIKARVQQKTGWGTQAADFLQFITDDEMLKVAYIYNAFPH